MKPQDSPLKREIEIPARWRQLFWVRPRLPEAHTETVSSGGWMSTSGLYLWTARRNPLHFPLCLCLISLRLNVICHCDTVLLCKENSNLIVTFVVKLRLGEGEDENTGREAKESFHLEELTYGVFCAYLVCQIYAVIFTEIVLVLIHDNFI